MPNKKKLNIHVTYASQTVIIISAREEFLNDVCDKFHLEQNDIEIFNIKDKTFIEVDDLKDFMKVEIKKRGDCLANGRSHSPPPTTSKELDKGELTRKILDNKVLSNQERAYMIDVIARDNYPHAKRRKTENEPERPEMKNKKIQVNPESLVGIRTTYSQTDELINYKPQLDTSLSANAIQLQSKRLAASDKIDAAVATDLMSKSYDKRRNFILLERPMVRFVKEKYPLLFSNSEVRNEVDRIFYSGKCAEFLDNVAKYSPHILSVVKEDDPLYLTTQSKIAEYKTAAQKKYAQEVGALLMISPLVLEDRNFLQTADRFCNPKDFPYIQCSARLHDLFFDQHIFKIFVEKNLLCEAADFKDAILCLIASYFVFNIKYPDDNFNTLVAIEKLFLEANDTDETDIDEAVRQIIRSIQLKWQAKSSS